MPRRFPIDPGFRIFLAELGLDASEAISSAELSPMVLRETAASLTGPECMKLWQSVEDSRDTIDVVLAAAKVAVSTTFSPVLFACACSPTYEIALDRLRAYKLLLGPLLLRMTHTDDTVTVTPEGAPELEFLPDSLAAAEVAYHKALIEHSTRQGIKPVRVTLPEDLARDERIESFFGTRPIIGREVSISFSFEDARRPFLTEDSSMWEFFEPELQRRLSAVEVTCSMVELTRTALLEVLPLGDAAIGTVANRLALSPRTLQRRLDQEGSSFKEILNILRCELAEHYLSKGVSTTETAFLLAYSEVNSFQRAFKSWKGVTPDNYRKQPIN